jgi:hypothetical protein
MRRIAGVVGTLAILLLIAAPVLAAEPVTASDHVLVSVQGDVTISATDQADVVVVVQGSALIEGAVNTAVVVDGTATLRGAQVETLTIVNGTVYLEAGTTVAGNVYQLNGNVQQAEGVSVGGSVLPLTQDFAGWALFIGTAAIVMWLGVVVATFVAGFALAAFASRQVRTTEAIISREPLKAFLVGLLMLFLPPIIFVALAVTIIGLPLALGMLLLFWPALAFIGYLVAAIWIGDWVLRTVANRPPADRPYLAAFVGLVVAGVLGFIPLVTAIISLFGLGAVTVAGWRTLTGGRAQPQPMVQPHAAPAAG